MNEKRHEVEELVIRARAGEAAAFEALYGMHQAGIYTFLRSQVRDRDLAADMAQETFVRAWESLARLRKAGAFRGWLHRIAQNLVRDVAKSGRARLEVVESSLGDADETVRLPGPRSEDGNPEGEMVSGEMRKQVWEAIEELPLEQRAAVVMHHMEEMSVAEIAEAMGVRAGTVMSRLARARASLRGKLSRYVEGSDEGM